MADLEEHAFKRDKRFIVRLALTLIVASLAGLFIAGRLTSQGTASCAADAALTGSEGAGEAPAPGQERRAPAK
jgi:hypothetical protein